MFLVVPFNGSEIMHFNSIFLVYTFCENGHQDIKVPIVVWFMSYISSYQAKLEWENLVSLAY